MSFSFSLDTIIPEEYQTIRIGGKYDETYSNVEEISKIVGSENITINSTLMSVNANNIIKLVEYSFKNKFDFFLNTYAKHGRITSPDWGLNKLNKKTIKKVMRDCILFLENNNDEGYNMQVKKILLLLKNTEYIPKGNWEHMKSK